MDPTGNAAGDETPLPYSPPEIQPILDANGQPVGNPDIEALPWPAFLRNLSMRILLFCVAAALLPVSIGVLWFTNIPRWQVLIMGGSSGVSTLGVAISLLYVRKGKFTKRDLDVQVALSADALVNNYVLTNPYTYQRPYGGN